MLAICIINNETVRRLHILHLMLLIPFLKLCTNYWNRGISYLFSKLLQVVFIRKAIDSWLPGPIVYTNTLVTHRETVISSVFKGFMYYFNNVIRITTYITIITCVMMTVYWNGVGWPWLDAGCSPRHSITLLLATIGRGENRKIPCVSR